MGDSRPRNILQIVDQAVYGALLDEGGVVAELAVYVEAGAIRGLLHHEDGSGAFQAQVVVAGHDDDALGGALALGTVDELGAIHI